MSKLVLPSFAVFVMLSSAILAADDASAEGNKGAPIGAKPGLRAPLASGQGEVNLRSYRGRLVLIHFWDPMSADGLDDVRRIAAIRDEFAELGLEVIGVIATPEASDSAEASDSSTLQWPQARPAPGEEGSVVGDWLGEPPFELPQCFLVAPDGTIIWRGDEQTDLESAVRQGLAEHPPFTNLNAAATSELVKDGNVVVLDVRTPREFAAGHLKGAVNIDIMRKDFSEAVRRLPADREYLVYCKSGGRSMHACEIMSNLRFERLRNLEGGIMAWQAADLPVVGAE